MGYKFLEHTADVKFLAKGKTIEQVFSFCADALNETIRGKINILGQEERTIDVNGNDLESLLYNFLEEFLFLLDSEDFLVKGAKNLEIDVEKFKLRCILIGDNAGNYKFTNDVKAITYNEMFIRKKKIEWIAQVVLDV
jgi:SHS2 domain-containing protein